MAWSDSEYDRSFAGTGICGVFVGVGVSDGARERVKVLLWHGGVYEYVCCALLCCAGLDSDEITSGSGGHWLDTVGTNTWSWGLHCTHLGRFFHGRHTYKVRPTIIP